MNFNIKLNVKNEESPPELFLSKVFINLNKGCCSHEQTAAASKCSKYVGDKAEGTQDNSSGQSGSWDVLLKLLLHRLRTHANNEPLVL